MISLIPAYKKWIGRRTEDSRISNLIAIGIIVTLLLLNVAAVFADNSTDLNVSSPTPAPDLSVINDTQPLDPDPAVSPEISVTDSLSDSSGPAALLPETEIISAARLSSLLNPSTADEDHTFHTATRFTQAQRDAAAANYKKIREAFLLQGNTAPLPEGDFQIEAAFNGTAQPAMDPGGVPHYFGPYANYANSPMPMGNISSIAIDYGGTGYTTAPAVSIADVYFTGSGATAIATVAGGSVTAITVTNPGRNYTAPVVIIGESPLGADNSANATATLGGPFTSGMRKFVDTLPGLNIAGANNLGQYIPVAQKDTTSFPGSDYYEIAAVQFTEKMHSDLPATTLRGYVQLSTPNVTGIRYPLNYPNGTNITDPLGNRVYAVDKPHYIGPLIVANNGTPVRVLFHNYLPLGADGNLFLPVDTTVMGAGMGPQGMNVSPIYFSQNRADVHLHGGTTPWISDGTPYQWTTPAGEYTAYPEGVSVYNVPDMPDPGPGAMTFFYTNQQSARLMFYHDHAHGITRLNVYAGEAAGYLVTDQQEQDMIDGTDVTGINPTHTKVLPDIGIPLIIQDKTWVDNRTIAAQDPTWNWGTNPGLPMTGDLWYPHVYMPAQNPYDDSGFNAYGRWHYGPWFYPPTDIAHGPVENPYYTNLNFTGEPPMMPGTPNPSTPGEAFMDTPIINGVAYPNVTLDPKVYRFRILNACNDRAVNLQLYVADANITTADGRNNTEVRMVPASPGTPGFPANWPTDGREGGVPDPAFIGPSFIQIGTEGGFLPAPVVVPNQPITWVSDPTRFDFGNVDKHTVVLMSAERADVLVNFSGYAGKTLILYNDAPAAYPAGVPQYDYYTGAPDRTDSGGAPTIQAGYGPNVRTIMQIKINNVAPTANNLTMLNSVFEKTAAKRGVFESSQPPIIIPQVAYRSAYNQTFTQNYFSRINDHYKNFTALSGSFINITFQPKALHDEMGAVYDQYGRMSAMLGVEVPSPTSVTAQFMPYGYDSPPTDVIMTSLGEFNGVQAGDGTQIWKISHNGVDSHPIHWHMYNVQVINRVGWDGFIRAPDPTELGWKETVRVSPLEDTIVALRPVSATVPFEVPDQIRAIAPTEALGNPVTAPPGGGWFDPMGNGITTNGLDMIPNHLVNYGWEYVWHCHILAHEEMDMMHAQAISVNQPITPPDTLLSGEVTNISNTTSVYLTWTDQSTNETDWIIQRSNLTDNIWYDFKTVPSYSGPQTGVPAMAIDDSIPVDTNPPYQYRVEAANIVGDDFVYDGGVVFPIATRNTTPSGINVSAPPVDSPVASFDPASASGPAPLTVAFTDTSTGGTPTGWIWDFGDGNFASDNGQQNPNHVFELPGTYQVTLIAMNTNGSSAISSSHTVTVTATTPPAAPIVDFTNVTPREGVAPFAVTFINGSTSDPAVWATWRWAFGDGTFSSVKDPSHTYLAAGNYTVSLAATNLGGTTTMTRVGYVNVSPAVTDNVGVYRNGAWYLDYNGNGIWDGPTVDKAYSFGGPGNVSVEGDWNGDGKTEIGVMNVTDWYLDYNGNGIWDGPAIDNQSYFGAVGYTPVVGDWDGNGKTKIGITNGIRWFLDTNGNGVWDGTPTDQYGYFGAVGYTPVVGDWDGNGKTKIGITNGIRWFLDTNGNGVWDGTPTDQYGYFGVAGYTPVVGDWDGNGKTKIGVTNNIRWFLDTNGNGVWDGTPTDQYGYFGVAGYTPVVGDWNGNGKTKIGVTNSVNWFLDNNGNGVWDGPAIDKAPYFGISGYTPVVGKW